MKEVYKSIQERPDIFEKQHLYPKSSQNAINVAKNLRDLLHEKFS
jgi:hypothetical protein